MERTELPVAVFDSGLGGISVLRALVQRMPGEDFLYFGDSANAPYGVRPAAEVRELTQSVIARLYASRPPSSPATRPQALPSARCAPLFRTSRSSASSRRSSPPRRSTGTYSCWRHR